MVDIEESGRSDRSFELACLTEHIGMWLEAGIDADANRGRFDLRAAEFARVLFFRRGFAIFWLYLVHNRPGRIDLPRLHSSGLRRLVPQH
jgi:hypothetical protein